LTFYSKGEATYNYNYEYGKTEKPLGQIRAVTIMEWRFEALTCEVNCVRF